MLLGQPDHLLTTYLLGAYATLRPPPRAKSAHAATVGTCILAGAIILPVLIVGVPETHQYKNLVRLASKDPQGAAAVKEAPHILARAPQFQAPWYPFQLLLDRWEAQLGNSASLLFLLHGGQHGSMSLASKQYLVIDCFDLSVT